MENYSVLMSVYKNDKPDWLRQSIESISNQTIITNDFVIVCDGPVSEEVNEVLEYYQKKYSYISIYRKEKNSGLGLALAYGLNFCKNNLVARMDADDVSALNRCEKELAKFSENSNLSIVGCWENEFMDDIEKIVSVHRVPETSEAVRKSMRRRCSMLHPTIMFKKDFALKCGNYHDVLLMEDYDFLMRLIVENNGEVYNLQEGLYFLRINDALFHRRGGIKYLKIVKKFKKEQLKKGNIKFGDYFISSSVQTIVCLMPNKLRKWFYLRFLRK